MKERFNERRWDESHQKLLEENLHLSMNELAALLDFSDASISRRKRMIKERKRNEEREKSRVKYLWNYSNENILTISQRADTIIAEFENKKKKLK